MHRVRLSDCHVGVWLKRCGRLPGFTARELSLLTSPMIGTRSMRSEDMVESNFVLWEDFITPEEEKACLEFVEPGLARRRYQENHWDDVISVYKEIEMPSHPLLPLPRHGVPRSPADTAAVLQTQEANQKTMKACIERVHASVRGVHGSSLEFLSPHVIDLAAGGFIGPHVDSLKFSGKLICGLSLSSTRVLRLVKTKSQGGDAGGDGGYGEGSDKEAFLDAVGDPTTPVLEAVIRPRSLYIMANVLRYEFTHEVLGAHSPVPSLVLSGDADADGELAEFGRRVSFMIRDTLVEK